MTDGCWVQFWDDENCPEKGATLRFEATTGTLLVSDLDDYTQSNGSKEGNEPDSLKTGTRSWLVVYKDDDFEGSEAMFGPNSQINDLGAYGVGGNISSFKLYDTRPSWFVESTVGNPVAYEANDEAISAATVNNVFRTVVAAAVSFIPGVGGGISILVRGLWPDVDQKDQVWGSFQNYLNQAIAGVYWQMTYESLNNTLESLFNAAKDFVDTPEEDRAIKTQAFANLYNLVNNTEPFFVDVAAPEKRFSFLVPFATLRLATLRENLENYAYYYGSEPSPAEAERLTKEIQDSIALYQSLLSDARARILDRRGQMIFIEDKDVLIDLYNGRRMSMAMPDEFDSKRGYTENVLNELALKLDLHIAVSQIWPHFDPTVNAPVKPPILDYIDGPMGYYWYGVPDFSQVTETGQITAVTLWVDNSGPNPASQNGLELAIDGVNQGRVGGQGGTSQALYLASGEEIVEINGSSDLRLLTFVSSSGSQVSVGDPVYGVGFRFKPLADTQNGHLIGVSGSAGSSPSEPASFASVRALAAHWRCELPIDLEGAPKRVVQAHREAALV